VIDGRVGQRQYYCGAVARPMVSALRTRPEPAIPAKQAGGGTRGNCTAVQQRGVATCPNDTDTLPSQGSASLATAQTNSRVRLSVFQPASPGTGVGGDDRGDSRNTGGDKARSSLGGDPLGSTDRAAGSEPTSVVAGFCSAVGLVVTAGAAVEVGGGEEEVEEENEEEGDVLVKMSFGPRESGAGGGGSGDGGAG